MRSAGPTSAESHENRIRALLAELGPKFHVFQTPHFVVLSSAAREQTEQLGREAEQAFTGVEAFANTLRLPFQPPPEKMTVVYFGEWEAYAARARQAGLPPSEAIPGFFDAAANHCLLADYTQAPRFREPRQLLVEALPESGPPTSRPASSDDATRDGQIERLHAQQAQLKEHERVIDATVIRHEITHQVLDNAGLRIPNEPRWRWLREGLAMQFEGETPLNRYRLKDFLAADEKPGAIGIRELLDKQEFFDPASLRSAEAYAAAWAIVYYLSRTQTAAFARYVQDRVSGSGTTVAAQNSLADFETAFGPVGPAMEVAWRSYIRSLNHSPQDR